MYAEGQLSAYREILEALKEAATDVIHADTWGSTGQSAEDVIEQSLEPIREELARYLDWESDYTYYPPKNKTDGISRSKGLGQIEARQRLFDALEDLGYTHDI